MSVKEGGGGEKITKSITLPQLSSHVALVPWISMNQPGSHWGVRPSARSLAAVYVLF